MNWFDYLLLAIIAAGAVAGMRLGVIGAAFMAVGGLVGWMLAGRLSDDVGGLLSSVSGDTWVTSLSYVVIVGLSVVIAAYVWRRLAGPLLMAATMGMSGMVNKVGGLALGVVIGATVSFALIVVSARLTYDFELPDEGIAGSVTERVPVQGSREWLEGVLVDSTIVSTFVDVADAVPGSTLGFIPSDFEAALNILEERLN
jgi:uncharacterized membrane protein required for colicin V production